jgi:hypothetical protein
MKRLWWIVAVVLVGAVAFLILHDSDESRIKSQLERLAHAVRLSEGDNPLFRAARIRDEFAATLDDGVRAHIPEVGNVQEGRGRLFELAMSGGAIGFQSFSVGLARIQVKLDEAHTSAKASATATFEGTRQGRAERDVRAVDFLLLKTDGIWRVTSITVWERDERLH